VTVSPGIAKFPLIRAAIDRVKAQKQLRRKLRHGKRSHTRLSRFESLLPKGHNPTGYLLLVSNPHFFHDCFGDGG